MLDYSKKSLKTFEQKRLTEYTTYQQKQMNILERTRTSSELDAQSVKEVLKELLAQH